MGSISIGGNKIFDIIIFLALVARQSVALSSRIRSKVRNRRVLMGLEYPNWVPRFSAYPAMCGIKLEL